MVANKSSKKTIKRKIWFKKKTVEIDPVVENYNAGEDIIYDQQMIPYDVFGSRMWARLLAKHNVITQKELKELEKGLDEILVLYKKGEFILALEDEDSHTKIEEYLIKKYGDTGKKIHTARSRNDQVLVMMRLFLKDKCGELKTLSLSLVKDLLKVAKKYKFMPMPGYTHMQKAMPTTVGTWLAAFIESFMDDIRLLNTVANEIVDQNPLGSGAGYGSPFNFDRDWLSKQLGFKRTQNNVIYCQNSRGKIEGMVLEVCSQLMLTLNKLACDLLFFTTQEFHFFDISEAIATGSSIMPQKRNLDVAELIRGRTATVLACKNELVMNIIHKISGYHRDGQEIKRPLFLGLKYTQMSLQAMGVVIKNITPRKDILYKSMTPELFAAHKAFEMVKKGIPFRDAYIEVGANLNKIHVSTTEIDKLLRDSKHQGGTGNLGLEKIEKELKII
ncbi:argininosuccinate lyase [Candidatus Peregrinibacteria bacterium]|nr:argininosuccinate lyase [Candidatus Peregrinibacteria bacterium]